MTTRRRFLVTGIRGSVALGIAPLGFACARQETSSTTTAHQGASQESPDPTEQRQPFTVVEVAGSYHEIGVALGRACRESIAHLRRSDGSFESVLSEARGEHRARFDALEAATRERFPQLMDELEGMAEGAGIDARDLFAWNSRAELNVSIDPCPPGCSTVGLLLEDGTMVLAHNEDGGEEYLGRMVVLRATPPSGVSFIALVYPGTFPGNGPGLNSRGIAQTTNYISCCSPVDGIPRYVLGRAILEANDLEEAVDIATTEGRAFPWHHNLASLPDARLVSLETWPGRHHRRDVTGIHLHTNHLVHPEMQGLAERPSYIERSSGPRLEALQRLFEERPFESREDLLAALNDRSGSPCRVCRQPGDEVPGVTLAAAIYESPSQEVTLQEGPPCQNGESSIFSV